MSHMRKLTEREGELHLQIQNFFFELTNKDPEQAMFVVESALKYVVGRSIELRGFEAAVQHISDSVNTNAADLRRFLEARGNQI